MAFPIQVTFRGMDPSAALEQRIREKAERLERFDERILGVDVVVQAPHRHHLKGGVYEVRIDLSVPGAEIVVTREPGKDHAHEDPFVAARDAFAAAQRRLRHHAEQQRSFVKARPEA